MKSNFHFSETTYTFQIQCMHKAIDVNHPNINPKNKTRNRFFSYLLERISFSWKLSKLHRRFQTTTVAREVRSLPIKTISGEPEHDTTNHTKRGT